MTDLFEKSIRTLELPAVLEKLAAKAVSDAAKERCLRLTPATDTQEVLHLLNEADAAKERQPSPSTPETSALPLTPADFPASPTDTTSPERTTAPAADAPQSSAGGTGQAL